MLTKIVAMYRRNSYARCSPLVWQYAKGVPSPQHCGSKMKDSHRPLLPSSAAVYGVPLTTAS